MLETLMPNYTRLPVTFTKGEGAWLWDAEGNRYLDALSGIAVCGLGHTHPAITEAICDQAQTLLHTSNLYGIAYQQTLADKLIQISGMETVFFCNSGAEANEAALKIARLYGRHLKIDVPTVIVVEGAFHGRTLATLTATGNPKVRQGFEPLMPGFIRVPYNDLQAIENVALQHSEVVAVLVEPLQGEGGIQIPDASYLTKLRKLCDKHNWLLMLDEIQTGIGRTGKWFAYQHDNILPDVLSLAKGLGNGIPVGACLARGKVASIFQPGTHGSTFGGNPFACRVALTVLETIEKNDLISRVNQLSQRFTEGFSQKLNIAGVKAVRTKGLLIGIELDKPCGELVQQALAKSLLINVTAGNVIRLLPPFILTDEQVDEVIDKISQLVQHFLQAT